MSGQPEQPNQIPSRSGPRSDDSVAEGGRHEDVWAELFGIVHGLAETVQAALQAFTPSDDKAVSAITKKRLALRSIHGLKQSQNGVEALLEHLKALQAASQTWQRSMLYASKSHQELMEQIESTTDELHRTNERLRVVEAQRLAAVREAELLRARTDQQEAIIKEAQTCLKQKEEDLETLQFSVHELQSSSSVALLDLDRLRQVAAEADERAKTATAALDEAKVEAKKAHSLAERHQQVVAKLTADNLVFLMQLKKVEADLAVANQERAQLRLAAEQQRGPWFDQVRAGVEERVRQALQQSQELEMRLEQREAEHSAQVEAIREQQAKLEEQLNAARHHAKELQQQLESANDSKERAESLSATSEAAARDLRKELDNLAAENRVLQDSIRSMRQECTERWVSEQAASERVDGLERRIGELQELLSKQTAQVAALQRQLDTQMGINRQLMARKEEMEWQLMAAMAKVDGGATDQLVPLNLRVSGLLQVGGPNQEHQHHGTGTINPPSSNLGLPASTADESVEGATVGHSTLRTGSAGSGTDTRQQTVPASASRDVSTVMLWQKPVGRSISPVFTATTAHGAGDNEIELLPSTSVPAIGPDSNEQSHGTVGSAVVAGGPSNEKGSPTKEQKLNENVTLRGSDSVLIPEPTLLVAQEDLVGITHKAACDVPCTIVTGHLAMHQESPHPQQQARSQQHGSQKYAVAGGRICSTDMPERWTSLAGASTVVSSPPSSITLSTEPGSPGDALSIRHSEAVNRKPSIGAVTIRTVSTVSQRVGGMHHGKGVVFTSGASGASRDRTLPNATDVKPVAGELAEPYAYGGPGQLDRRGSLHDGEDVWLVDVASTSSSDDSDFLFSGGVVVQHQSHITESLKIQTAVQQANLYNLQQPLQTHLQGTTDLVEAGRLGWHRSVEDSEPCGELPPQARVVSNTQRKHGDKEDVFHERAPIQRHKDGSGVMIRSGSTIQSAPTQTTIVRAGQAGARDSVPVGRDDADQADLGTGVFNIVKTGVHLEVAPRSSDSPMHPALSGGKPFQAASNSPKPVSPSAVAASALAEHSQRTPSKLDPELCSAGPAQPSRHKPELDTSAEMHPIPARLQAGPPFYATGCPLDSNALAALERWTHSTGGIGTLSAKTAVSKLREITVLASPTRSISSPRSPAHPAITVVANRQGLASDLGNPGKAGVAHVANSVAPCVASAGPAVSGSVLNLAVTSISGQVARVQIQPVSSPSNTDECADTGTAEVPGPHARPRVSFYEFTQHGQTVPGAGMDGNTDVGRASMSSMSSSTGSLINLVGGGQQTSKPNSMKNVRFSDHDPDDDVRRRGSQEQQRVGFPKSTPRCVSPVDTVDAWSVSEPYLTRLSGVTESSQHHRSRGPASHPAMLWVSTASTGAGLIALDAAEGTPAKRYSAAGVTTTTVPRASAGPS